jgi:aspartyl-tRNA(Asn)/glutamyl-tRNA(Gln) amidotransferase subunit A
VFPLSWSLDHAGPLTRSVADAAILLSGLVGRAIVPHGRPLAGLRIGLVGAHLDSRLVTAGVREAVSAALDRLGRGGATLVPVSVPEIDAVNGALVTILKPEAALAHESLVSVRPDGYAPGTRAQLEAGRRVSGIDYVRAQRFRARLTRTVEALFEGVDVLLSPAVGFVAPAEDPVIQGGDGDGEMLSSGLANVTGHPAISLPCGFSDGLPVGLQLIGPGGRDADLLSGAAAVEACLAFSGRPPL